LEPVELREGFLVLRAVRGLLGGHDGIEARDPDRDARVGEGPGFASEVVVAARTVRAGHALHHAQVPGVGPPVRDIELAQQRLDVDGQGAGLLVASVDHPQVRMQLPQRGRDAGEVVLLRTDQCVAARRRALRAVGAGGVPADDQVLDAVAVEDLDHPGQIGLRRPRQGPSPS
jgi:hypothetical protein